MTLDKPVPAGRFPVRFLTATVVLTGAALAWLGWNAYDSYHAARKIMPRNLRIEELRGEIIHLDEVLTMSARMAAATGDMRWEERYRKFEPQLDAAIKEAVRLAPEAYGGVAAAQTDAANIKLVEMENRAFDLVRRGARDEARAILFSDQYEGQKDLYADGMREFDGRLKAAARAALRSEERKALLHIPISIAVLLLLSACWLVVLRTVQAWKKTLVESNRLLARQAEDLSELSRSLEQKVRERTAELEQHAERLRTLREIDGAILAEKSLDAIAGGALAHIRKLIPCSRISVVALDPHGNEGTLLAVEADRETALGAGARVPLSALGRPGETSSGKLRMVEDISALPDPSEVEATLLGEGILSYAVVPLMAEGELVGFLNLGSGSTGGFSREHCAIALELGDVLAVAIDQARVEAEMRQRLDELERRLAERA